MLSMALPSRRLGGAELCRQRVFPVAINRSASVGLAWGTTMAYKKFALMAAVAMLAGSAQAAVVSGYSRATFQGAVAGSSDLTLQNFDSLSAGMTLLSDGSVSYGSSTGSPLITNSYLTSTSPNGLGRTGVGFFLASDSATFNFASAITAFAIDVNTFAVTPGSYQVTLNTGDTANSIYESFPGNTTGQFIGLTSTTAFTGVTLRATTGFSYTLDTLIYGSSAPVQAAAVPEPATWAMMVGGFGLAGGAMRRRRSTVRFA